MKTEESYLGIRGYKDVKQVNTKLFKFCIWFYRLTGIHLGYLKSAEIDFIVSNISKIRINWIRYKKEIKRKDPDGFRMDLSQYISLERGCWQGHHRISRKMTSSRMLKIKMRIRWWLQDRGIL